MSESLSRAETESRERESLLAAARETELLRERARESSQLTSSWP